MLSLTSKPVVGLTCCCQSTLVPDWAQIIEDELSLSQSGCFLQWLVFVGTTLALVVPPLLCGMLILDVARHYFRLYCPNEHSAIIFYCTLSPRLAL